MSILFITLAVLLLLRIPVGLALVGASMSYLLLTEGLGTPQVLFRMINGVDSFTLLAIPFFVFAGAVMNVGGVTERIFGFADAVVGWMKGGLGHVNVAASVLFSGMSGSAVADVGGLGAIEVKAMREAGYDDDFSIGITGASSIIGPLIPPSLPLIIYGVVASESIGSLFLAGILPGVFLAVLMSLTIFVISWRRGYEPSLAFNVATVLSRGRRAIFPLLTPALIIGGIMTGVFTPTEAAVAASAYALILSTVVFRSMSLGDFTRISRETAATSCSILIIVAGSAIFSWLLTANNVGRMVQDAVTGVTSSPWAFLFIVAAVTLIVGCFLDMIAAITILVPILLPTATALGVDPIQFGIFFMFNLMLGLLTPPVGMVIFVLAKVADVTPGFVSRSLLLFLAPLLLTLLALLFIPGLSTALPNILNGGLQ
ncbi:TRAP transporter large permease [Poseidonocella sedimentorum]|uniref:TRAP transporter large permease protein n=1 Tax=Poseidonocella sedimentorum TaxID=871652 RepID=A0A1I6DLZ1_9RHOB|nr:TRAP transporter large permease [Poseidonocella sedimentorum]SFR06397.1 TRAP transporter, DctM subunit [Poseidonocella sedimentorum]